MLIDTVTTTSVLNFFHIPKILQLPDVTSAWSELKHVIWSSKQAPSVDSCHSVDVFETVNYQLDCQKLTQLIVSLGWYCSPRSKLFGVNFWSVWKFDSKFLSRHLSVFLFDGHTILLQIWLLCLSADVIVLWSRPAQNNLWTQFIQWSAKCVLKYRHTLLPQYLQFLMVWESNDSPMHDYASSMLNDLSW